MTHPSPDTLEHYVIGALQGAEAELFETHVTTCRPCADQLAREARLEVRLGEAARRLTSMRAPRQRALVRLRWTAVAAIAAAAAAALLVARRPSAGVFATLPAAARAALDTRDQLMVRNDSVVIDGLDESMAGSDLDSDSSGAPQSGAMQ